MHACIESSFNQGNIIHLHVSEVASAHHLQQNSFVLDINDVFLCPSSFCWYEKWSGPMEGHIYTQYVWADSGAITSIVKGINPADTSSTSFNLRP